MIMKFALQEPQKRKAIVRCLKTWSSFLFPFDILSHGRPPRGSTKGRSMLEHALDRIDFKEGYEDERSGSEEYLRVGMSVRVARSRYVAANKMSISKKTG
jgi:hypothetical protein